MYYQKTYEIYINKKPVQVPYLILLCHCTGEFNYLVSKEEYTLFFTQYRFSNASSISEYVCNLNSYIDVLEGEKIYKTLVNKIFKFKRFQKKTLENIYSKVSLFSISQLLYEYTIYRSEEQLQGAFYATNNGLNKYINYPAHTFSKSYNTLIPHLSFYKKLALCSEVNKIEIETLEKILEELNKDVKLKNITQDLEDHMLILPYKDYYIWGASDIYNWLLTLDYFMYKLYNLDKVLSLVKFNK